MFAIKDSYNYYEVISISQNNYFKSKLGLMQNNIKKVHAVTHYYLIRKHDTIIDVYVLSCLVGIGHGTT